MKNPQIYILLELVLFSLLFLLNISFYSTYSADQCKQLQLITKGYCCTGKAFDIIKSLKCNTPGCVNECNGLVTNQEFADSEGYYCDYQSTDTSFTISTMNLFIGNIVSLTLGLIYFFNVFFSLITFLIINKFDPGLSFRFSEYGFLDSCLGRCTKCGPFFNKLFHYFAFLAIVGYWAIIITDSNCAKAVHYDATLASFPGLMHTNAIMYNGVNSFFWFILHIIFPLWKHKIYWPNYMYEPIKDDSSAIKFLFHTIGP